MKLYMKEKVFSWGDRFTVKDQYGEDKYTVVGEVFSWGKKLHVYDRLEREVAFIKQELFSFLPRYHVFCEGEHVAEIKKEFTFLFPRYTISASAGKLTAVLWPMTMKSPKTAAAS